MFCPSCGRENPDEAMFCMSCGTRFPPPSTGRSEPWLGATENPPRAPSASGSPDPIAHPPTAEPFSRQIDQQNANAGADVRKDAPCLGAAPGKQLPRKKNVLPLILAGGWLAVLVLLLAHVFRPEPMYQGKPLSYWAKLSHSTNDWEMNEGFTALTAIGEPACSDLIKAMQDPDLGVRYSAFCAVGDIGPKANSAVPALREALSSSDGFERAYAACALTRIDPSIRETAPVLLACFGDKEIAACKDDPTGTLLAAIGRGLLTMAEHGQMTVIREGLISHLGHEYWFIRARAADTLGVLKDPGANLALADLMQRDAKAAVRMSAASALGTIASRDEGVVAALRMVAFNDNDETVRAVASDSLRKMGK